MQLLYVHVLKCSSSSEEASPHDSGVIMQHVVAFVRSHSERPECIFRRAAAYESHASFIHTEGEVLQLEAATQCFLSCKLIFHQFSILHTD